MCQVISWNLMFAWGQICLIPLNLIGKMQLIYEKFWSQLLQSFIEMQKNFSSFYGLLQDNLLPNKFVGDITLIDILLAEIGNHLLSFFRMSECKLHGNPLSTPKIISEIAQKSLHYIAGYLVHKLYSKFKFSNNKNSEYPK